MTLVKTAAEGNTAPFLSEFLFTTYHQLHKIEWPPWQHSASNSILKLLRTRASSPHNFWQSIPSYVNDENCIQVQKNPNTWLEILDAKQLRQKYKKSHKNCLIKQTYGMDIIVLHALYKIRTDTET